jgi:hypothetical protein
MIIITASSKMTDFERSRDAVDIVRQDYWIAGPETPPEPQVKSVGTCKCILNPSNRKDVRPNR